MLGHHSLKALIERTFAKNKESCKRPTTSQLTTEEVYAIRYAAGYIPRALTKKLNKTSHHLKDSLLLCLWDLLEDENEGTDESKIWVDEIDRGGLTKVNDVTYNVFLSMEMEIRKHLSKEVAISISDKINNLLVMNDEVQFHWSILSSDWEEECSSTLLVSQWVNIRGFSFASAWIEEYKTSQKKTTQKSKGIRKKLM